MQDVRDAIRDLLRIVKRLHDAYPHRRFTLDGRLVGDLGEVLAADAYAIDLLPGLPRHHDAMTRSGRMVQVKATMKRSLTFPADHVPQHYLGIRIDEMGHIHEIFNGPGSVAARAVSGRKPPKNNLHSIGIRTLESLNAGVPARARVPRRRGSQFS